MNAKPFGWTGVPVPVIGQGTWHMGESRRRRDREVAALTLGLDLGLTHIDTAEMYGKGGAEEVVGTVIRGRRRSELFLVSKVLPENASYDGTIRAAEQSLRRLRTDYLDLYLLHWRGRFPLAETMAAMETLVASGKIRFVGVSNFEVAEMRDAMSALRRERLACNQVLYHPGSRGIELELIPFCQRERIAVVGYTPYGHFPRRKRAGPLSRSNPPRPDVLAEIGRQHGATARQVCLAFLTRAPGVFAIPKASDPAHVRENAGASALELTPANLAVIDRAFPAPPHPVPLEVG